MKMSNKVYDRLKWVALVLLPALTTLYSVIGSTFAIPYTEQIITVAVAVDTCLGTCLGISSHNYNKEAKQ
jgi:hypothetical protein